MKHRGKPMFEKVAFTMFPAVDARRARAFYEDVLGLTRGLSSPDGVWTEYDLPGGGCLALFCHAQAPKPGGGSIALEVADLDALNARLQAAGVEYRGDIVHGPSCRMSNIVDSEGNAIILHELAGKRGATVRGKKGDAKSSAKSGTKGKSVAKPRATRAGARRPAEPRRRARRAR